MLGIQPQHTAQTVYNLEVQGQHVFRVTSNGLLVHNSCGNAPYSAVGDIVEETSGVVTGLRKRGNFNGMTLTGQTRGGTNRVSSGWRARYGPSAVRRHHLVPQELLQNQSFMQRMRALGYTDDEIATFVNRQISDLPNVQHMQIHAEGWNNVWHVWLQRNPNFDVSDIRAQIKAMMNEFELPKGSLGGRQYGRR